MQCKIKSISCKVVLKQSIILYVQSVHRIFAIFVDASYLSYYVLLLKVYGNILFHWLIAKNY